MEILIYIIFILYSLNMLIFLMLQQRPNHKFFNDMENKGISKYDFMNFYQKALTKALYFFMFLGFIGVFKIWLF